MKYGSATLGQTEAVINRMGGMDNWLRYAGGQGKVVFETILTLLRTWKTPPQMSVTTSKEYFAKVGVKVTGTDFETQFYGLEVAATAVIELAVRKLEEGSLDAPIMAELGDKAEIGVGQFRAFLAANRKSAEWFIFYLRGKDGNLWAVRAWRAGDDGWFVRASSVDSPVRWIAGRQVVSRN